MTADFSQPQEENIENQSQSTWRTIDVLLISTGIIAVFSLVILLSRYIISSLPPDEIISNDSISISIGLTLLECITLPMSVYILGLRRHKLSWSNIGLVPFSSEWLIKSISLGIFAIPLSGLITLLIQFLLGQQFQNPQIEFLAPEGFSWYGAISMVILVGIVTPFAEEVYFRGVLYPWIRSHWGPTMGILFSSFIFGIIHGNISIAGAAIILGIILAWTFERSNSLWPSIIIHTINNFTKIIILYAMLAYNIH